MSFTRLACSVVFSSILLQLACNKPTAVPVADASNVAPVVDMKAAQEAEMKLKMEDEAKQKSERDFQDAKSKAMASIYFDLDRATIREEDKSSLQFLANFLRTYPQIKVQISGHADERGTNEYNLALGNKRASATVTYLKGLGIDESRLQSISFGKEKPICNESNEACWSRNRRAEFTPIN
ncbi:MAG: peptidoglycan-associated lipoprotein Pal [Holophagaceae bacterium]